MTGSGPDRRPRRSTGCCRIGCDVVVDLAAGTGLLTRALAGKASRVIAVEPDDRMRAVLESRSGEVEALAGRGEAIPLPGG